MNAEQNPKQVLTSIWSLDAAGELDPDENCSPTKQCRNTKDMAFDGYAPEGTDLGEAWRALLRREGKMASGAESIRDLVFGAIERNE
jgi:hypothetical protein